jgi:hydroxymethylbilane synthase
MRPMSAFTYATRRSALALAQCRAFVQSLAQASAREGHAFEELQVVTTGDRIVDRPLQDVGGKGLFVKEIEEALLAHRAHFAVHSIKDVPAHLPDGLTLACLPVRQDPRDVLVSPQFGTLEALPSGAVVGTSSLRRAVALRAVRPDLVIVPLRGNVDTRLKKVESGELSAIVLARAGLLRLGLASKATQVLEPEVMLPAVGQGALGVECRAADNETLALLRAVHDGTSAVAVAAERGVLEALEGDCRTPLGAFAERVDTGGTPKMRLRAFVSAPDGSAHRQADETAPWPSSEQAARDWGRTMGEALKAG